MAVSVSDHVEHERNTTHPRQLTAPSEFGELPGSFKTFRTVGDHLSQLRSRVTLQPSTMAMWAEHKELPQPRLREPWHGYSLGNWNKENLENAKLILEGKYRQVGEKTAQRQKKVTADTAKDDIAIGR